MIRPQAFTVPWIGASWWTRTAACPRTLLSIRDNGLPVASAALLIVGDPHIQSRERGSAQIAGRTLVTHGG